MSGEPPRPGSARDRETRRVARRRGEQRWWGGLIGAPAGAAVGAAAWAWVAVQWGVLWGGMALLVGALAGLGTRWVGRGAGRGYGLLAAAAAVAGCAAGHAIAVGFVWARQDPVAVAAGVTGWTLLGHPARLVELARANIDPRQFVFYAIAAVEAWWLGWERVPAPPV